MSLRILLLLGLCLPAAAVAQTHCTGDETVYFNCQIRGSANVASLCGAGYDEARQEAGYLQYRFGPPGRPQLLYPAITTREAMLDKFTYSASRSRQYDRYDYALQFTNNGFVYSLQSHEDRRQGHLRPSASLRVLKLAGACAGRCAPAAPYATPKYTVVRLLQCANANAGEKLNPAPAAILRLLTSPGHGSANKY